MSQLDVKVKNQIFRDLAQSKDIGQESVETMVITRNDINIFPEELLNCRNTRYIQCSLNKISIIPSLGKFKKLTVCDLSNNRITGFPVGVLACPNIKVLDLSGNRLKCLSTRIADLKQLRIIRASDNFITDFPEGIFDLKLIEVISLRNNCIKTIPSKIGKLKCLKLLFMQQNMLMTVPFSIVHTAIGDPNGKIKLEKNFLVPTLRDHYSAYGKDGILNLIKESDPKELFKILEKELRDQAGKMFDRTKTKTLKKKKEVDKLKAKKIKTLIVKQKHNVLNSSNSGLFSTPVPLSPSSALNIKIMSQPNLFVANSNSLPSPNYNDEDEEFDLQVQKANTVGNTRKPYSKPVEILRKPSTNTQTTKINRVSYLAPLSPIDTGSRRRSLSENSIFLPSPIKEEVDFTHRPRVSSNSSEGSHQLLKGSSIADHLEEVEEQLQDMQVELSKKDGIIRISRQTEIFDAAKDLGMLFENIYQQLDQPRKSYFVRPIEHLSYPEKASRISIYPAEFMKMLEHSSVVQEPAIQEQKTMSRKPISKQSRLQIETQIEKNSPSNYSGITPSDESPMMTARSTVTLFDDPSTNSPVTINRNSVTSRKLVNKRLELEERSPRKISTRSVLANNFEEMMKTKENEQEISVRKQSTQSNQSDQSDNTIFQHSPGTVENNEVRLRTQDTEEVPVGEQKPSFFRKTTNSFMMKSSSKPNLAMFKDKELDPGMRSRSQTFTLSQPRVSRSESGTFGGRIKSLFKSNSKDNLKGSSHSLKTSSVKLNKQ